MTAERPVALITGGAKRVGAAIATELARRGLDLVITYNTSATEADALAASLEREHGVRVSTLRCDLADPDAAADLTSVLCLVGSVFAIVSRYAVLFWNQGLHQGASLSLDRETNVDDVFWRPLVLCLVGFFLMFLALLLLRVRTEIRLRRARALRLAAGEGA